MVHIQACKSVNCIQKSRYGCRRKRVLGITGKNSLVKFHKPPNRSQVGARFKCLEHILFPQCVPFPAGWILFLWLVNQPSLTYLPKIRPYEGLINHWFPFIRPYSTLFLGVGVTLGGGGIGWSARISGWLNLLSSHFHWEVISRKSPWGWRRSFKRFYAGMHPCGPLPYVQVGWDPRFEKNPVEDLGPPKTA